MEELQVLGNEGQFYITTTIRILRKPITYGKSFSPLSYVYDLVPQRLYIGTSIVANICSACLLQNIYSPYRKNPLNGNFHLPIDILGLGEIGEGRIEVKQAKGDQEA